LLQRQPFLVSIGGALLGYVAGDIAVSDPVVVGWVNSQSPALNQVVPLLCATFVLLQARIIRRQRTRLPKPEPKLRAMPSQALRVEPDSLLGEPVALPTVACEVAVTDPQSQPIAPALEVRAAEEVDLSPGPPVRIFGAYSGLVTVLAGLGGIFLISGLLYSLIGGLSGGLIPTPKKDNVYVCTGASTTLYYRPGGSSIRMVTGGGEATGYVRYKKILWENQQNAIKELHLTPPSEIEKTSATIVTLSGGSFSQIQCALTQ
ncbi:MAG: TerC family protein, partial [Pseudomonas sp.]|nr:TerC family protein [Pseudomonas sp.]